jgi:hypothetical protein
VVSGINRYLLGAFVTDPQLRAFQDRTLLVIGFQNQGYDLLSIRDLQGIVLQGVATEKTNARALLDDRFVVGHRYILAALLAK